ncbi:MAG: alpha/beta hydrolase [Bacilli bacterium]|nr:alpha/beta hydrolase [Bacilli bacterium]
MNNLKVNYEFTDNKSDITLILLHGWGQNIEMMKPIGDKYKDNFNILILDLPGFGKSEEPPFSWTIDDYVELVHDFVKKLKLKRIVLIGHSFGGRVSLLYASKYKCDKLICLASPYCPEVTKLPLKNRIYKKLKKIPVLNIVAKLLQKNVGSSDYRNASEVMRGVLVKAVNYDLTEFVKKIECPTLLVWGDLDTAVPYKRAYELQNLIKDSGVVLYNGATHYAYLERLTELILVLDNFLGVRR